MAWIRAPAAATPDRIAAPAPSGAPLNLGGGKVARYQVKCAALPIVAYEDFDFARDAGKKRNWWRAVNCAGEPKPGAPGKKERFVVTGAPADGPLYVAIRTFDDSSNRSALSNVAQAK